MIDVGAIRASYGVAQVLDAFGIRRGRERCACPLCAGRNAQAFAFGGKKGAGWLWQCFSCGEKGDAIDLFAKLGQITKGRAMHEIAARLGLTDSDPTEIALRENARRDAAVRSRDAEIAVGRAYDAIADYVAQCERGRDRLIERAYATRDRDLLAKAYDAELDGMIHQQLLDERE